MEVKTSLQFSVFLVNKPGVLAQVTKAIATSKLNIVAMTLVDQQEHGVLRLLVDDVANGRAVLTKLNLPMTETEVILLDLSNRPGALAEVATLLGEHHVNINYAYVTSGAPGGRTTGVFKVADPKKAEKILKGTSGKKAETTVRRMMRR